MYSRRLILLAFIMACTLVAHAEPAFVTKRLETVSRAVDLRLPDNMGADADDTTYSYRGRVLRVRTNAFGEVSSIGYRLFSREMSKVYSPRLLLDFLERYALELDLRLDKRDAASRMNIDGVVCSEGSVAMLRSITVQTPFAVEEIERRMYRVRWTLRGGSLRLTFPADYQLLMGADAVELEDIFERNVRRMVSIDSDAALDDWSSATVSRSGSLLVANGGQYLSPLIRSDIYLRELRGRRTLVNDRRKPLQTVSNILLTGQYNRELPLRLTINRYGYKATTLDVTLQQFVTLCRFEGCQLYVGVKSHKADSISATLFALNTKMAYNHVLSVTFPLDILSGSTKAIAGTAYVYIPLQNVTEIFFTEDLKQ